jgi:hypothetical protein
MAVEGTKVVTKAPSTLSFPNLLVARAGKGNSKAKFSAALLFLPETLATPVGQATLDALKKAVIAAAESKWGANAAEMFRKKQLRSPFRDDAEAKDYPAGTIFLNVRTEQKPACVFNYADPANPKKPKRMTDEEVKTQMYAGAQVLASLVAFPYDTDGNKGVSFALNNLQKIGEGERIDGRTAAEDEFDVDLSAAPVSVDGLI